MAHYAFLNNQNIVTEVITGIDETETIEGLDTETWYGNFRGQTCKRTSYNNQIRKQYAGIGYSYDAVNDVFISPQPFASWSLDQNFDWQPPTPMPSGNGWKWDEDTISWSKALPTFDSWFDIEMPSTPSIFMDTVARSAGRFFYTALNNAFPTVNLKWGYLEPHNPNSFSKALGKFDTIITIVREPKDSIASSLIVFKADNDESIMEVISQTTEMLQSIADNIDNLLVFTFEQVTQDIVGVLTTISNTLKLEPLDVDEQVIKNQLAEIKQDDFYSVPIDNTEILNKLKTLLDSQTFADKMAKVKSIYDFIAQSL